MAYAFEVWSRVWPNSLEVAGCLRQAVACCGRDRPKPPTDYSGYVRSPELPFRLSDWRKKA